MAINDKIISAQDEELAKKYGSEILILNPADRNFIFVTGVVTGSDTLNGEPWIVYRDENEINDGTKFKPLKYLEIVSELGIVGKVKLTKLDKRKSRDLKTATSKGAELKKEQYKELFKGRALFTDDAELKGTEASLSGSSEFITYADLPADVKSELDSKMIESDEILEIKKPTGDTTGDISYIRVKEGREIIARSMRAQGFRINRKNLREKDNAAGTRGRFNTFNKNQEDHYASGSWKTNGGGPRIQGFAGGGGSCKFVIIHRSGSIG